MKSIWCASAMVPAAVAAAAGTAEAQALDVAEEVLPNGMRILAVERHRVPRVFCAIFVGTGAAQELTNKTGLAHLLEHMLFKGTRRIGVKDLTTDAALTAKADTVMAEVYRLEREKRALEARGESVPAAITEAIAAGRTAHKAIASDQKKVLTSEELWSTYQAHGGTSLNASTGQDSTQYFVELPSNKLELYFWLESDRLREAIFREYYAEVDVVKEERRMRTESTPTGLVQEEFSGLFWGGHPYGRPVVGFMRDLDVVTREDAEAYFRAHYVPENMTAVFVGGVKPAEIFAHARRYFGPLVPSGKTRPEVNRPGPTPYGVKRQVAKVDAPDAVEVQWPTVAARHADAYALDMLASVLSGRAGRLYRHLVEEKKLALTAQASAYHGVHGGAFSLEAQPREGVAHAQVEEALLAELAALAAEPPTADEWDRAQTRREWAEVQSLENTMGIAFMLGRAAVAGDWREALRAPARYKAVTPADVMRVASAYLAPERRAVLDIERQAGAKTGTGPGGAADPATRLKVMLGQLEANWGRLPREQREQALGQVRERLPRVADTALRAELEKKIAELAAKVGG